MRLLIVQIQSDFIPEKNGLCLDTIICSIPNLGTFRKINSIAQSGFVKVRIVWQTPASNERCVKHPF